jgi:hypothetical protein
MEHKRGNEAYIILHRGARSRGYKRREGARARASERESLCVLPVSSAPRPCVPPLSTSCIHVNVSQREPEPPLGRPWTSPFIDTRRCPAVQRGVAMRLGAFLAGTTCRDLVSKLGRKTPTKASELIDIATKFASGQEAVEAIFRKDKQPQGR